MMQIWNGVGRGVKETAEFKFCFIFVFFFFKQKTAYEIGTGDWSSDVCSSDLQKKLLTSAIGKPHFPC